MFGVGTETRGSIISPSAENGVTGLRPTYGRVSRYGAMALSWTMDKIGPMCRSVEDCAIVFNAIYGPDGRDETTADAPFTWNPGHSAVEAPNCIREKRIQSTTAGRGTRAAEGPPRAEVEFLQVPRVRRAALQAPEHRARAVEAAERSRRKSNNASARRGSRSSTTCSMSIARQGRSSNQSRSPPNITSIANTHRLRADHRRRGGL